jgi:hypothetical protein
LSRFSTPETHGLICATRKIFSVIILIIMSPQYRRLVLPIAAFLTSIVIAGLIITVTFKRIDLTASGPYSGRQRALYATGTTIIASILTAWIQSQIRQMWVYQVDHDFPTALKLQRLGNLNSKWRTILRVASFKEMLFNGHIQTSYLVTALITTAIVASFTPTLATRGDSQYEVVISSGQLDEDCEAVSSIPLGQYYWNTSDNRIVTVQPNAGSCPTKQAVTLIGNINIQNPDVYAYSDVGVAVHSSAIGAPASVYASIPGMAQTFADLIGTFGTNLVNLTQCVPVMTKNPVSCRTGGTVNVSNNSVIATSDDNICSIKGFFPFFDPLTKNTMTKDQCTYGEVGQAKIVLAGTNHYGPWLSTAMGDPATLPETYVVTCDVDTRDVFAFRNVTFSSQTSGSNTTTTFARHLDATFGGNECSPPSDYGSNTGLLAIAALANWQTLYQNIYYDGWFDSIAQFATVQSGPLSREPPWAFSNSKNALEDVFGLTAALVSSRMNSTVVKLPAQVTITNTQIGTGHPVAILYAIPPLVVAVILLYQIVHSFGLPKQRYTTISLEDLTFLGRTERYSMTETSSSPNTKRNSRYRPSVRDVGEVFESERGAMISGRHDF